jgi:hypothetical protein
LRNPSGIFSVDRFGLALLYLARALHAAAGKVGVNDAANYQ